MRAASVTIRDSENPTPQKNKKIASNSRLKNDVDDSFKKIQPITYQEKKIIKFHVTNINFRPRGVFRTTLDDVNCMYCSYKYAKHNPNPNRFWIMQGSQP